MRQRCAPLRQPGGGRRRARDARPAGFAPGSRSASCRRGARRREARPAIAHRHPRPEPGSAPGFCCRAVGTQRDLAGQMSDNVLSAQRVANAQIATIFQLLCVQIGALKEAPSQGFRQGPEYFLGGQTLRMRHQCKYCTTPSDRPSGQPATADRLRGKCAEGATASARDRKRERCRGRKASGLWEPRPPLR